MNKKILIGAGIVTLLIIIGGIAFLFLRDPGEGSSSGIRSFFPFGNANNTNSPTQIRPETIGQTVPNAVSPQVTEENDLKKISAAPISGATFLKSSTSTGHVVRFIERATGHIYDANLETGAITRISNTTIPKIESISWNNSGSAFIAQMTDSSSIKTKIVEIVRQTSTSTENQFARIDEFALPDNLISPTFSNQNNIFYLARGISGIEGFLAGSRGESPKKIWQFPTAEWVAEWAGNSAVALTSKSGNSENGTLYLVNPNTGGTSFVFAGVPGLTTKASPSGKAFLYSISNGALLETYIYSIDQKDSFIAPFTTLAEKCIWTSDEASVYCFQSRGDFQNLPDSWYQGTVSFNDRLWRVDTASGETKLISELTTLAKDFMDAVDPAISSDGKYILFKNKKDFSLWVIETGN